MKITNLPLVTVVVPTYNRAAEVIPCLQSLLTQDYPHFEIIVIDDGSAVPVMPLLEKHGLLEKRVQVIRFSENRGVGAARQAGIEHSRAEYVAFTDDDATYPVGWLSVLVSSLGDAAGVGGPYNTHPSFSFFPKLLSHHNMMGKVRTVQGVVTSICGGNCLFRRSVLNELNGFTGFPREGEDRYLCYRMRRHGYELQYAEKAICYHRPRTTLTGFAARCRTTSRAHINLLKLFPSEYSLGWAELFTSDRINPNMVLQFPKNLIRIAYHSIAFIPSWFVVLLTLLMKRVGLSEGVLFNELISPLIGWALRETRGQISDFWMSYFWAIDQFSARKGITNS